MGDRLGDAGWRMRGRASARGRRDVGWRVRHRAGGQRQRRVIASGLAALVLAAVAAGTLAGCLEEPSVAGGGATARVVRVLDGDTLVVRAGGAFEHVRLLGIDAPERARGGAPAECGARRASASLAALARPGRAVRLRTDPATGDVRDSYARLLAFVSVGALDLGLAQIERGWARVYAYRDRAFSARRDYERAYAAAADRGLGIHGECEG